MASILRGLVALVACSGDADTERLEARIAELEAEAASNVTGQADEVATEGAELESQTSPSNAGAPTVLSTSVEYVPNRELSTTAAVWDEGTFCVRYLLRSENAEQCYVANRVLPLTGANDVSRLIEFHNVVASCWSEAIVGGPLPACWLSHPGIAYLESRPPLRRE